MQISDIIALLEQIAPPDLQEDYDNSGLIVGNAAVEVTGAVVCLDSTPEVIAEAKERGCNLVIAHHPIIFRGLKRLTGSSYVERAVMQAVKQDIAIYALHTNLDNILYRGVNGRIANRLGLREIEVISPLESQLVEDQTGAGVIGWLPDPMSEEEFLALLKEKMELQLVRHTPLLGNQVERVAVCGGSGSFLIQRAGALGANVFVTADIKYHDFFDADGELVLADIGHFESERFTIDLICELLTENFPNFAALSTEINTNPVSYYT